MEERERGRDIGGEGEGGMAWGGGGAGDRVSERRRICKGKRWKTERGRDMGGERGGNGWGGGMMRGCGRQSE